MSRAEQNPGRRPAGGDSPDYPELGAWAAVRLVASREFDTRLRTRVFKISTAVLLVLVVGAAVAVQMLSGRDSTTRVGILAGESVLAAPLTAAAEGLDINIEVAEMPDEATGLRQVTDGDLDVLVMAAPVGLRAAVQEDLDDRLHGALTVLARQLVLENEISVLGGDPAQVNSAVAAARVDVRELDPQPPFQGDRLALGIAAGLFIYMGLMLYGSSVAQGVIEEKASRVVELLLSTVRPWTLMAGKVLGIGAVGLIQLVVLAGGGLAAAFALDVFDLPSGDAVGAAVWVIVWYLVGFFLYALPFAAVGAMVSRQEDIGGVSTPLVMSIIVPWVLGVSILPSDPDSGLIEILSIIPLFSPVLMPMRIALGVAPAWQTALSLALTLVLAGLLVRLAGRIYRNAVLRTGARVSFAEALRSL